MDEWKNERAEYEMKLSSDKIMKRTAEMRKHEDDPKWEKLKETLLVGNKTEDDIISSVIEKLKAKFHFPLEI